VADRAGAAFAGRAVAQELQRSAGLAALPDVTVSGVPFLTQAVAGRYERIDVTARDVPTGEVAGTPLVLTTLRATLRGARVPLSDAVSGTVAAVPVDRVDARVLLPYSALTQGADGGQVTVSPAAGGRLRLTGSVRVLGRDVEGSALSRLEVDGDALVLTAESFDVGGGLADRLVTRALRDRFDLRVGLDGLPYGLQVEDVRVRADGLEVTAGAVGTVLSAGRPAVSGQALP
jgi:hypothetical protein